MKPIRFATLLSLCAICLFAPGLPAATITTDEQLATTGNLTAAESYIIASTGNLSLATPDLGLIFNPTTATAHTLAIESGGHLNIANAAFLDATWRGTGATSGIINNGTISLDAATLRTNSTSTGTAIAVIGATDAPALFSLANNSLLDLTANSGNGISANLAALTADASTLNATVTGSGTALRLANTTLSLANASALNLRVTAGGTGILSTANATLTFSASLLNATVATGNGIHNQADSTATLRAATADILVTGTGTGIRNNGTSTTPDAPATLTLTDGSLLNATLTGTGYAIVNDGSSTNRHARLAIANATTANITVIGSGTGIHNYGANALLTIDASTLDIENRNTRNGLYNQDATLIATDSRISLNATGANGNGLYNTGAAANITITRSHLALDSANAYALNNNSGNITLAHTTVTSTHTGTYNGIHNAGTLTLLNATITASHYNTTNNYGALVNFNTGILTATDSTLLVTNTGTGSGPGSSTHAFYNTGRAFLSNTILSVTATNTGTALYSTNNLTLADNSALLITAPTTTRNSAYITGTLALDNSLLLLDGAELYASGTSLTAVNNSRIAGTGTLNANFNAITNGAIFSPGGAYDIPTRTYTHGIGNLTIGQAVAFTASAQLRYEWQAGNLSTTSLDDPGNDRIRVLGALNFTNLAPANFTLTPAALSPDGNLSPDSRLYLLNSTGTLTLPANFLADWNTLNATAIAAFLATISPTETLRLKLAVDTANNALFLGLAGEFSWRANTPSALWNANPANWQSLEIPNAPALDVSFTADQTAPVTITLAPATVTIGHLMIGSASGSPTTNYTITATNNTLRFDTGDGTLSRLTHHANAASPDTIAASILLANDLEIRALSETPLILSGQIGNTTTTANITINGGGNLTLRHTAGGNGIRAGNLTVTDVNFAIENTAGYGIWNTQTATITGGTLSLKSNGGYAAIQNDNGTFTIDATPLTIDVANYNGIYSNGANARLTIRDTTINATGGAFTGSTFIYNNNGNFLLQNTTFTGTTAGATAIYSNGVTANTTITDSTIAIANTGTNTVINVGGSGNFAVTNSTLYLGNSSPTATAFNGAGNVTFRDTTIITDAYILLSAPNATAFHGNITLGGAGALRNGTFSNVASLRITPGGAWDTATNSLIDTAATFTLHKRDYSYGYYNIPVDLPAFTYDWQIDLATGAWDQINSLSSLNLDPAAAYILNVSALNTGTIGRSFFPILTVTETNGTLNGFDFNNWTIQNAPALLAALGQAPTTELLLRRQGAALVLGFRINSGLFAWQSIVGNGIWNDGGNWENFGATPDAPGANVLFIRDTLGPVEIDLENTTRTVGDITIGSENKFATTAYTLANGTLVLDSGDGTLSTITHHANATTGNGIYTTLTESVHTYRLGDTLRTNFILNNDLEIRALSALPLFIETSLNSGTHNLTFTGGGNLSLINETAETDALVVSSKLTIDNRTTVRVLSRATGNALLNTGTVLVTNATLNATIRTTEELTGYNSNKNAAIYNKGPAATFTVANNSTLIAHAALNNEVSASTAAIHNRDGASFLITGNSTLAITGCVSAYNEYGDDYYGIYNYNNANFTVSDNSRVNINTRTGDAEPIVNFRSNFLVTGNSTLNATYTSDWLPSRTLDNTGNFTVTDRSAINLYAYDNPGSYMGGAAGGVLKNTGGHFLVSDHSTFYGQWLGSAPGYAVDNTAIGATTDTRFTVTNNSTANIVATVRANGETIGGGAFINHAVKYAYAAQALVEISQNSALNITASGDIYRALSNSGDAKFLVTGNSTLTLNTETLYGKSAQNGIYNNGYGSSDRIDTTSGQYTYTTFDASANFTITANSTATLTNNGSGNALYNTASTRTIAPTGSFSDSSRGNARFLVSDHSTLNIITNNTTAQYGILNYASFANTANNDANTFFTVTANSALDGTFAGATFAIYNRNAIFTVSDHSTLNQTVTGNAQAAITNYGARTIFTIDNFSTATLTRNTALNPDPDYSALYNTGGATFSITNRSALNINLTGPGNAIYNTAILELDASTLNLNTTGATTALHNTGSIRLDNSAATLTATANTALRNTNFATLNLDNNSRLDITLAAPGTRGLVNDYSNVSINGTSTLNITATTGQAADTLGLHHQVGSFRIDGTSTISATTALIDGTLTGNGTLTLNNASILAGTGTLSDTLNLNLSAGTIISPGTRQPADFTQSAAGTLTLEGNRLITTALTLAWQLGNFTATTANGNDLLKIAGTLELTDLSAADFTLDLNLLANLANFNTGTSTQSQLWTLIETADLRLSSSFLDDWNAQNSGTITAAILAALNLSPDAATLRLTADSQNLYLQYLAIPEPAATALLLIGTSPLLLLILRRRHRP